MESLKTTPKKRQKKHKSRVKQFYSDYHSSTSEEEEKKSCFSSPGGRGAAREVDSDDGRGGTPPEPVNFERAVIPSAPKLRPENRHFNEQFYVDPYFTEGPGAKFIFDDEQQRLHFLQHQHDAQQHEEEQRQQQQQFDHLLMEDLSGTSSPNDDLLLTMSPGLTKNQDLKDSAFALLYQKKIKELRSTKGRHV